MPTSVEVYYDFRSPYAYFASRKIRTDSLRLPPTLAWRWRPVSIDILLNLQAGRDPWAPYADPLVPAKRRYLLADVRRCATYYGAPLGQAQTSSRPNPTTALCAALLLDQAKVPHDVFREAVFDEMWQARRDIGDPEVIASCLDRASLSRDILANAQTDEARGLLTDQTT